MQSLGPININRVSRAAEDMQMTNKKIKLINIETQITNRNQFDR